MSKLGKSEMLHGKKYIGQQKEMFQEDDYGSRFGYRFVVKVFQDKDWAGKLLGQPILMCTPLVGLHVCKCDKKSVIKCCEVK